MIESHPFAPFVPFGSETLVAGSFPGRFSTGRVENRPQDDWYYGAPRNQFWTIISRVFERDLRTTAEKKALFSEYKIAVCDIILSCERRDGRNTDGNLIRRTYNRDAMEKILVGQPIRKILFTGAGVAMVFVRLFKTADTIEQIVLPSPSPLFCRMNLNEKVEVYRRHLLQVKGSG